jgi:hypothetical protein
MTQLNSHKDTNPELTGCCRKNLETRHINNGVILDVLFP